MANLVELLDDYETILSDIESIRNIMEPKVEFMFEMEHQWWDLLNRELDTAQKAIKLVMDRYETEPYVRIKGQIESMERAMEEKEHRRHVLIRMEGKEESGVWPFKNSVEWREYCRLGAELRGLEKALKAKRCQLAGMDRPKQFDQQPLPAIANVPVPFPVFHAAKVMGDVDALADKFTELTIQEGKEGEHEGEVSLVS